MSLDPRLVVMNPESSLEDGAIPAFFRIQEGKLWQAFLGLAKKFRILLDRPWVQLSKADQDAILYGRDTFEGIMNILERRMAFFPQLAEEEGLVDLVGFVPCAACQGKRLKKDALFIRIGGVNIADVCAMSLMKAMDWLLMLKLSPQKAKVSERILKEIRLRLGCLIDLGLGYLTLERPSRTLSGGEGQRIRLASQLGSGLSGVLYVLDEPSIGLHPRDNQRLLKILMGLRDLGNTVLVVEHDRETIESADYVIDLGPGAGEHGGHLVFSGTAEALKPFKGSVTADYLTYKKRIPMPIPRRKGSGKRIVIRGIRKHNLKGITLEIPLGMLVGISGVSGSGKSTLVVDVLVPALKNALLLKHQTASDTYRTLEGLEHIDKVTAIDQSPIGRTPRSNPATYTGALTLIRELFAQLPESRSRGFSPGRFSFNVKGGRCEACKGEGIKRIEMHFLPDVDIPCEVCSGLRFNRDTLGIRYNGKNIAQVLDMTIEEAFHFFRAVPPLKRKLETLIEVGMGYIRLGQSATTRSGGEAQRLKLSRELSRKATGRTLYVFDEPTTGLHFMDIDRLLKVIQKLVDQGNTALVIEHNLDVLKCADFIIDLGPEGGEDGGLIVAQGPPEVITQASQSETGRFLRPFIEQEAFVPV
jgi:excinuclease ABC subunit A